MNSLLLFEFKRNLKSSIIWTISLIAVISLFSVYFPLISESGDAFTSMMESFPPEFLAAFGMEDFTKMFTIDGFYGFYGLYIAIIFGIFSSLLALNLFSYTKTKRIEEYILSKPVSRYNVFVSRTIIGLIWIAIAWVLYTICGYLAINMMSGDTIDIAPFLAANFNMLMIVLCSFFISMLIGVLASKIKIPVGVALPIVFAMYGIDMMMRMLDKMDFSIVSPFSTFSLTDAIENGINGSNTLIYIGLFILIYVISSFKYCHEDVRG